MCMCKIQNLGGFEGGSQVCMYGWMYQASVTASDFGRIRVEYQGREGNSKYEALRSVSEAVLDERDL